LELKNERYQHEHPKHLYDRYRPVESEIKTGKINYRPPLDIKQVSPPDLTLFKPVSSEVDYSKFINSEEMNEGEFYAGGKHKGHSTHYKASPLHHYPHHHAGGFKGPESPGKIKKVQLKPISTPGLKHYSSHPKFSSRLAQSGSGGRPEYASYFRGRQARSHRDASQRLVQKMLRTQKSPVPRYAAYSS
jgi:hypothetical protein